MMTKKELAAFKAQTGFNIWQIEKDYLQHLYLLFLSRHSKKEYVFKGGTALQKAYGLNRFSIDLDFTCEDRNILDNLIGKVNNEIIKFGYPAEFKKIKELTGITYVFKIKGPLYDGTEKSISTLYIEISLREKVLLDTEAVEINPVYPDIQPYILAVMNMSEIIAEKVRAILCRNKPRDVFDMWFLIKKGIVLDENIINQKLSCCKMKFDREKFIESIRQKKARWTQEMSTLLSEVPDFEKIVAEIERTI